MVRRFMLTIFLLLCLVLVGCTQQALPSPTAAATLSPDATMTIANSPEITLKEFEAIALEMTYQQVCDIVGGGGRLLSNETDDGVTKKVYMWSGVGSLGANANVTFENDIVTNKSQFGLKDE